jgi:hypothetical protein
VAKDEEGPMEVKTGLGRSGDGEERGGYNVDTKLEKTGVVNAMNSLGQLTNYKGGTKCRMEKEVETDRQICRAVVEGDRRMRENEEDEEEERKAPN